jgi:hypothetical protein
MFIRRKLQDVLSEIHKEKIEKAGFSIKKLKVKIRFTYIDIKKSIGKYNTNKDTRENYILEYLKLNIIPITKTK